MILKTLRAFACAMTLVSVAEAQQWSPMPDRAAAKSITNLEIAQGSQCQTNCRVLYDHCTTLCIQRPSSERPSCRADCSSDYRRCQGNC